MWAILLGSIVVRPVTAQVTQSEEPYLIDTWDTDSGLPQNTVTAIVQTPDGYLWFGTFDGLARFDGLKCSVFDRGNTPQLPSSCILNLYLDRNGRLWVSTDRGVVIRDATGWRAVEPLGVSPGKQVWTFAERANGDVLLTMWDGAVWEFAGGRFVELPRVLPPTGSRIDVPAFGAVDETGRWWVVQAPRILMWDGSTWVDGVPDTKPEVDTFACATARDGGVWLLNGNELRKYRGGSVATRCSLSEAPGTPWTMTEDSDGNVWVATQHEGICRVSPAGLVRRWNAGAPGVGTRCAFEDREGNIWVGTSGHGLQRYKHRRFRSFGPRSGLAEAQVQSVCSDNEGGLWIGTFGGGLARMRGDVIAGVPVPAGQSMPRHVQTVLQDHRQRVWIGTFDEGLWVIDSNGLRRLESAPHGLPRMHSLFEDSRGRVWIGYEGRLMCCDGEVLTAVPGDPGVTSASIRWVAEDRDHVVWLASQDGVFRWENERPVEVLDGAAPIRGVTCLAADSTGTVYVCQQDQGLMCFDSGRLLRLATDAEFRQISGILDDGMGFLWMSTNRGVLRVQREAMLNPGERGQPPFVHRFDKQDGLPSTECANGRQPVSARDGQGRLWFATLDGLAMADPARFRANQIPPQVRIESLHYRSPSAGVGPVAERSEVRLNAPFADPVTLPAGSWGVEIAYTATSLSAPKKVQFQVQLDGSEGDGWREVGDQRELFFSALPPGDYVFRVRAVNEDGVWSETPASLAFSIPAYFWQTGWFRSGAIALLLILGAWTTWWYTRSRLVHTHERLELVQQRTSLAHLSRVTMLSELSGSLAHELNQPLTAILSNAQAAQRFLAREPADINEVREILTDVVDEGKRAGEVIHRLRLLLKKGEVEQIDLDIDEVLREVIELVRSDLINHGVSVRVQLDTPLPRVRGDRVQLQQVLVNLVINAGEAMAGIPSDARRLAVSAQADGESHVRVSVSDTGTGIAPEHLGQIFRPFFTTKPAGMGLGLAVCRTIIKANGGDLWAANNPERGATFHFTLPVVKETAE